MILGFCFSETSLFSVGDKTWITEGKKVEREEDSDREAVGSRAERLRLGLGGGLHGKLRERGEELTLEGWGSVRSMEKS